MGNYENIIILLAIVAIVVWIDRKKFKREGILFLRRTRRGISWIDRNAKRFPRFWSAFTHFGVLLSFGALGSWFMINSQKGGKKTLRLIFQTGILLAIYSLIFQPPFSFVIALTGLSGFIFAYLAMGLHALFTVPEAVPALSPVIPGVEIPGSPIFVPLWYGLAAIFIILIIHELSHAFAFRREGIRLKSLGYGFLGFLLLGFAEPDQKQIDKTTPEKRVRVYAAGSTGNIVSAIAIMFAMMLMLLAFAGIFEATGIGYTATTEGFPAHDVIPETGFITSVDGKDITNITALALAIQEHSPGETASLRIDDVDYEVVLGTNPNNDSLAFIGIEALETRFEVRESVAGFTGNTLPFAFVYIYELLYWVQMLSLGIGMANLMPLKPFDGGFMIEDVLKKASPKNGEKMYRFVALLTLGLVLANLFGPYLI